MKSFGALPLLAIVVGVSGCGSLATDFQWSAELTAPATFCPASQVTGAVSDVFTPATNMTVQITSEDEDIYNVRQLGGGTGAVGDAFGDDGMQFDLGPLGTVYDDSGEVTLTFGDVNVIRRLIDGTRRAEDEVELNYAMEPACGELEFAGPPPGSCTCESATFTWNFKGQG